MAPKRELPLVTTPTGRKVRDYGLRRIVALQYMKDRVVEGLNVSEVARKHGVNRKTVDRTLTWAEKAGLFLELEDKLLAEIGPLALDAIKSALLDGRDVPKGAIEVLQGLNVIKKNHPITTKDVKEADDLASYINQQRLQAQLDADTTEGQLLEPREPKLIPGYSPELLGAGAETDERQRVMGEGDAADAALDHSEHPERVSDGDGEPLPAPTTEEGTGSDENRVSSPETAPGNPGTGR